MIKLKGEKHKTHTHSAVNGFILICSVPPLTEDTHTHIFFIRKPMWLTCEMVKVVIYAPPNNQACSQ